jgi:hypothetical protein
VLTNVPEPATQGLQASHLKYIWSVACFVTLVGVVGLTPWDALLELLADKGVSDDNAALMAFVAGYTFPLVLGAGICTYLVLRGHHNGQAPQSLALWGAGIMIGAALVSGWLGLGQIPNFMATHMISAPPYVALPVWVVQVYLNEYGIGLALAGAAIGAAAGTHAHLKLPNS